MASTLTIDKPDARTSGEVAVGQRRRVGGVGQVYEVVSFIDGDTVLIHTESTGEQLPYPIADAQLDPLASDPAQPDLARFAKLVGQYRTIGTAGPTYQVVNIVGTTHAKIWIIPNDDDDDYKIENILLDPIHRD